MGFYSSYKAVFDAVKAKLEAVSSIEEVVMEERFTVSKLPMCVVNMEDTSIERGAIGSKLDCNIAFSVIVFVMETEPTDWFTDIIVIMGDVFDAIVEDNTLSTSVVDVWPTMFAPGEAYVKKRRYFGGIISFQALMSFTPSQ
jgi:hypothetical protein